MVDDETSLLETTEDDDTIEVDKGADELAELKQAINEKVKS